MNHVEGGPRRPDNQEPTGQRNKNSRAPGEGTRGVPQGEQARPQQEGTEGNKEQQGPKTFDGHEPDAWKRDPVIFGRRASFGMVILGEKVDRLKGTVDRLAGKNQTDEAGQNTERSEVDQPLSLKERAIRLKAYREGLRDAHNLIVDYINGKPAEEEPEDELSQDGDLKK
jgi:hypothetical protein